MNSKNPIRLSTVEEDFKRIGILKEDDESSEKVPMSHADAAPGGDPVEHGKGKKDKGSKKDPESKKPAATYEGWHSRVKAKIAAGEKVQVMHPVSEGWRSRVMSKLGMGKKHLNMGLETVSSLMEDVQGIVNRINISERSEMVKGFAQIAIIAETVGKRFGIVAESDEDFRDASENLLALAEASASLAEGLHGAMAEGADFDVSTEQIESDFKGMMANVLEGLEVYSQLVEMAEAEDDKDSDDAEKDDDADKSDDDDDSDDKKPAFLKKKAPKDDDSEKDDDADKKPEDDTDENFDSITQAAKNTNRPRGFNQDDRSPNAYGAEKGAYESKNR